MWYKLIETSNKDLWVVAFEGSMPKFRIAFATYGLHCNVSAISHIDSEIDYSQTDFNDSDVAEIPIIGSPTSGANVDEKLEQPLKPDAIKTSPNKSTRGATITHIILHNTAGGEVNSISWLANPVSKVSAHLVIGRTARVTQMVPFAEKAWHAGSGRYNACSIGIEIVATDKERGMTPVQEKKVVDWCLFIMDKYGIKADCVLPHRAVSNTDCPVLIWPTDEIFYAWRKSHLGA
jgi:hypothetical protein